jgi:hypothetical protein
MVVKIWPSRFGVGDGSSVVVTVPSVRTSRASLLDEVMTRLRAILMRPSVDELASCEESSFGRGGVPQAGRRYYQQRSF